jgi:hypothetical protein
MDTTKSDSFQRLSLLKNGVLAPKRSFFTPFLACTNWKNQLNQANQLNITRFWWDSVHKLNFTIWVQKTQNRKSAAIFKVGRRRHLENQWNAVGRLCIARFWWNLIHRLKWTCWVQKEQNRKFVAIFKDGHRHQYEKKWNALSRLFIARFGGNLVHTLTRACWVQKTQNRKFYAILEDGRRRHLESQCNAVSGLFITRFWWNLVHRLGKTCRVQKAQSLGSRRHFGRWLPPPPSRKSKKCCELAIHLPISIKFGIHTEKVMQTSKTLTWKFAAVIYLISYTCYVKLCRVFWKTANIKCKKTIPF